MVLRTFRRQRRCDDNYCARTGRRASRLSRPHTDGTARTVRALVVRFHGRSAQHPTERLMNNIIYLVGLVVVVMAILSFIGIH